MDFQAARYLIDRIVPGQAGNDHPYSTPMGAFETSDGFINIGVGGDGQWRAFCVALGQPDLAKAPEYATLDLRFRNRPKLTAILSDIFKTKSSSHWLDKLEQRGVPAGPIYRLDEVFADPQVEHLGIAAPLHHPTRGDICVVGQPIGLSRTPASVDTALPELGAPTDKILRDAGYSNAEIADFHARKIV
jgi:crotonobetainyl-CoA:carnitine CoA-transferase CaiB-like acyl-CoA transferase